MPTTTGHTTAITASRVLDANVYNAAGEKIGHVEDLVLDKTADRIKFAVLGFGGFLGIGERYHALPWAALNFSEEFNGYVVNISRAELGKGPQLRVERPHQERRPRPAAGARLLREIRRPLAPSG